MGSNQGRSQRDVMNYREPTRVKTPYDPKGPGLHGDGQRPIIIRRVLAKLALAAIRFGLRGRRAEDDFDHRHRQ
jgi:hypothetical protein